MKLQDIEIIKKIKKEVVLATIINTKGSSPRDDARMVVAALQSVGTQIQNNQLTGLQLQASQESLTAKLKELVEDVDSEDVPPVE